MAEIADQDLDTLKKATGLLATLSANPQARAKLEEAVKAADPNYKTTREQAKEVLAPELEGINSKLDTVLKRFEDDDAARTEAAAAEEQRRYEERFSAIRSAEGLTDEGVEDLKKLMVERNIADPDAAFALWQKQHPAVEPVQTASYEPQGWNFEENAVETDLKGLFADPDRWADKRVGEVLTDMRKAPAQG